MDFIHMACMAIHECVYTHLVVAEARRLKHAGDDGGLDSALERHSVLLQPLSVRLDGLHLPATKTSQHKTRTTMSRVRDSAIATLR